MVAAAKAAWTNTTFESPLSSELPCLGLLFLLPSEEEGMKAALEKKGIEVAKIKIKASKTQSVENQLQKLCFQDPETKYLGQRVCPTSPGWITLLRHPISGIRLVSPLYTCAKG